MMKVQYPTIVLPQSGSGLETIQDTVVHYSIGFETFGLDEKQVSIWVFGTPMPVPNLLGWVEVSSWSSTAHFAMVGAPVVFVNFPLGASQYKALAWTMESRWARVVLQCPTWVLGGAWGVNAIFEART